MTQVRLQQPPNTIAQPEVDFRKNDFDALIWNKGYNVEIEKAYRCPCKSKGTDELSSCRNCGGSGWFFINPTATKMVMQGMNHDDKYKHWSSELIGTVKITYMERDRLSWMDRITSSDAVSEFSEVLFPAEVPDGSGGTEMVASTTYAMISIDDVFVFQAANQKHLRLDSGQYDFSQGGYYITITDQAIADIEDLTISVRYKHRPQFHVIDIPRDIMTTYEKDPDTDLDKQSKMVLNAVGRRAHYVLDKDTQQGTYRLDNSYPEP